MSNPKINYIKSVYAEQKWQPHPDNPTILVSDVLSKDDTSQLIKKIQQTEQADAKGHSNLSAFSKIPVTSGNEKQYQIAIDLSKIINFNRYFITELNQYKTIAGFLNRQFELEDKAKKNIKLNWSVKDEKTSPELRCETSIQLTGLPEDQPDLVKKAKELVIKRLNENIHEDMTALLDGLLTPKKIRTGSTNVLVFELRSRNNLFLKEIFQSIQQQQLTISAHTGEKAFENKLPPELGYSIGMFVDIPSRGKLSSVNKDTAKVAKDAEMKGKKR